MKDHYVRVITDPGEEMILMRLSNAMRETGGVRGAQMHRSHMAPSDAVAVVRRQGDRARLAIRTGHEIPAGRANPSRLREAGLLPR